MKSRTLVTGTEALVSGASGFLGGRLVDHLLKAGHRVRALVRESSDLRHLPRKGIEIIRGDLSDPDSLKRAVEGQEIVFHTAGKVSDWGRREEFFRVNTEGTARLLKACRQASVRRIVHLSSLTVLGLPRDGAPVNEETPPARPSRDAYSSSKLAAEEIIRQAVVHDGQDVVIVRPGVIWGRGDLTIIPRLAALLKRRRMVYIGRGDNVLALSQVDNLCSGLMLAAAAPSACGQIYHITDGEEITARQAIDALAAALGVPRPRFSLPYCCLYGGAWLMECAARLAGSSQPPPLTRYGVRLVACDSRYGIEKARTELGYHPVKRFEEGMAELDFSGEER